MKIQGTLVGYFFVVLFLGTPYHGNTAEKNPKLPSPIVDAVLQSGFMTRDSGQKLTVDFLNSCVKERLTTYIEFYCDDLLWSYYLKTFKGKSADYIYFIEDGTSVENRAFFRIKGKSVVKEEDSIPALVTRKQVAEWLNQKFKTKHYTVDLLQRIAHSHYRTRFSKKDKSLVSILSGEQSNPEHAYKPIGQVRWNGNKFELK